MPKLLNTLTKEEIEYIINLYQNNVSLREIEKITKHGRQAIGRMLEELGIKTSEGNNYRYYTFDYNFFENIDNELKAYWLGFLYADGCILSKNKYGQQEFKLALSKQDEETIINYKKDLKSTYPIRYDKSKNLKNSNHQIQVIQSLRSQKTVEDLKKLGCVEKKSLILDFPNENQVPEKYLRHFIRGYFDGDGSITSFNNKYNISITGTENFIKKLYSVINKGCIFSDKRKKNSWYLNIGGNLQVLEFYHFLYDDATRYMKRKYDKFQNLLNKYSEN